MVRKLGVFTCSSPVKTRELKAGLGQLDELGVAYKQPAGFLQWATKPHSVKELNALKVPQHRLVEEFRELVASGVTDIMMARGGYGSIRLIRGLESLKRLKLPRDFRVWGFSDLTTIQHYLFRRFGVSWVHSPMLISSSFQTPKGIERRAWKFQDQKIECRTQHLGGPKIGRSQSRLLIGGNLRCLLATWGTPAEPKMEQEFFLFLEDLNEPGYRLDRLLQQLSLAAWMKKCRGVFLGYFTDCPAYKKIFVSWSHDVEIPVYTGIPCGHERPNVPILMGRPVSFSTSAKGTFLTLDVPGLPAIYKSR